jgi:site-specific DNA-methyltransferase (adenine-specific)
MTSFETEFGHAFNEDCRETLNRFPDNFFDLVITSPPYNIGISYDTHDDNMPFDEYWVFIRDVFDRIYPKLKRGGRIAVNVLYEANFKKNGGRFFFASYFWQILQSIGYKWAGLVDLKEASAQRSKLTAWGSWLSAAAPYIYNPKECVLIGYKGEWKRKLNGDSWFTEATKKEFIELTSGQWEYTSETHGLTNANFSIDIPMKSLKALSMANDIVYDPFSGAFTTALACEKLERQWVGSEISKKYFDLAKLNLSMFAKGDKMYQQFLKTHKIESKPIDKSILDNF